MIQEAEANLAAARADVAARENEVARLQEQHKEAVEVLRRRYAHLEAAEARRRRTERANQAVNARRTKWAAYGCAVEPAGDSKCSRGYQATFARGTPDERVVVPPMKECHSVTYMKWQEEARTKCEAYARTFLAAKELTEEDITSVLDSFFAREVERDFPGLFARPD